MLKELRKKRLMTQTELGHAVGVSQKSISAYETNEREVPVKVAKKLGEVLGFDWTLLYEAERTA